MFIEVKFSNNISLHLSAYINITNLQTKFDCDFIIDIPPKVERDRDPFPRHPVQQKSYTSNTDWVHYSIHNIQVADSELPDSPANTPMTLIKVKISKRE